ncbi:MAG: hypothetical protein ACXVJ7_01970 [Acidimicrobiia bacterium]
MDRVRRLVVALLVLLVAALVALVVTVRPGLRDDAEAVDTSWKPLVPALNARYKSLAAVRDQMKAAGLGDRAVTVGLSRTLERWTIASTGTDASEQVETAGELETLAARAKAMASTPRLLQNQALALSFAAFTKSEPTAQLLRTYNDTVVKYQGARDGFWSRIVARLDGYAMRPTLQLFA